MSRASTASDSVSRAAEPRRPVAQLASAVATHPGLVRERNEDRVLADPARGWFIVVDGMGGEAAGDQAAETALQMIRQRLERATGSSEERIREGIAVANDEILARARRNPSWSGMGCVLTTAVVEDGRVTVGHVGDSRLYLLRDGGIEKITRDHSPVGEREDRGEIDERAAMDHPRRNEVYRSIGAEPHGPFDQDFMDVTHFRMDPEDGLLLCTDGLTDLVSSEEIVRIVAAAEGDLDEASEQLIRAALGKGGKDNVSVVLAAGPRFGEVFGVTRGSGRVASRAAGESSGAFAGRWIPFALGVLAGALIAAALSWFGAWPPFPTRGDTHRAPRVLEVGSGARFALISDALAAARAGDTVRVGPGTYHEQVRLGNGVTLMSVLPQAAILIPTSDGTAVVGVVAEGIGSGRIQGFAIRGTADAPLDVGVRLRDTGVAIEDVEITDARVAGVVFEGSGPASVSASRIHGNPGAGVLVREGAEGRVAHNRIEDNGGAPHRSAAGIELEGGARAEIVENVIAGNAAGGIRGLSPLAHRSVLAHNVFEVAGKKSGPPLVRAPESRR